MLPRYFVIILWQMDMHVLWRASLRGVPNGATSHYWECFSHPVITASSIWILATSRVSMLIYQSVHNRIVASGTIMQRRHFTTYFPQLAAEVFSRGKLKPQLHLENCPRLIDTGRWRRNGDLNGQTRVNYRPATVRLKLHVINNCAHK